LRLRKLILAVIIILLGVCAVYWLVSPTDDSNPCGDGHCCLTPVEGNYETVFLQHYYQGISYWRNVEFEEARGEFRQALLLDRNFPGINQMIADSSLKLKEYDAAEAALNKEFELLGCLDSMTDAELQKYATSIRPVSRLREELSNIRAASLYHLACIYSFRKERLSALDALEAAIEAGFDENELTCPELEFIRTGRARI